MEERPASKFRDTNNTRPTKYVPESLPYTTAASEFLYGYSTVLAALKANRRKLYKLYIHDRGLNHEGLGALVARAKVAQLSVHEVGDEYLRPMDKASSGRPHNVCILVLNLTCSPILTFAGLHPRSLSAPPTSHKRNGHILCHLWILQSRSG